MERIECTLYELKRQEASSPTLGLARHRYRSTVCQGDRSAHAAALHRVSLPTQALAICDDEVHGSIVSADHECCGVAASHDHWHRSERRGLRSNTNGSFDAHSIHVDRIDYMGINKASSATIHARLHA